MVFRGIRYTFPKFQRFVVRLNMNIVCVICSDRLTPSDDVFYTPCGHIFHFACLTQWLERLVISVVLILCNFLEIFNNDNNNKHNKFRLNKDMKTCVMKSKNEKAVQNFGCSTFTLETSSNDLKYENNIDLFPFPSKNK